ncbi:MAG: hypothetical protein R2719_11985 [Micropruina sp.]
MRDDWTNGNGGWGGGMNLVLKVARMQLINRQTFVWVPLMIIVGAFVTWLIFAIVRPAGASGFNGAARRRCGTSPSSGPRA